jgi:hypothetical protein
MPLIIPSFVSVEDVANRMQLDMTLAGVEDAVTRGIQAAQLHIEGLLHGHLVAQARNDIYFLDSEAFSSMQPGGRYRLQIRSGFVRQDPPVTITFGSDWKLSDIETADPVQYEIDYARGFIHMDSETYGNSYVRIGCTTGFLANVPTPAFTTTPAAYDPAITYQVGDTVILGGITYIANIITTGNVPLNDIVHWTPVAFGTETVPDAIAEAIMSFVPSMMNASQTSNMSAEVKNQYDIMADHAILILAPYYRMGGFTFRPLV